MTDALTADGSTREVARDHRAPLGDLRAWARDFALIGGVSGFLAPFLVAGPFLGLWYPLLCGLAGAATGAWLGRALPRLLTGPLGRVPIGLLLFVAPALGVAWGLAVGLIGALVLPSFEFVVFSAMFAGIAAGAQFAWLWLPYTLCRIYDRPAGAVVALACAMPLLAYMALRMLA